MTNIRDIIEEAMAPKGFISFERFMELALYCPNFGYYERPDMTPGRKGDYFTSVSVGSLFGELLARQFAEWLKTTPGPPGQVLEAGAHDGQLAHDILSWLRSHQMDVFDTLEYWILEPSARRRDAQEALLKEFAGKMRWFDSWDALPASGVHGIIFSNELLDAMPARRLGWDASAKKWFEWGVMGQRNGLAWTKIPGNVEFKTPGASWTPPAELLEVLPDGFTTEVCRAAVAWWRGAARALKAGRLLAFDYGLTQEQFFSPERGAGTLRAYYRHHLAADLLERAGEQDITAQVNFSMIEESGKAEGLKTERFVTQAQFLTGVVETICRKNPSFQKSLAGRSREFQTLAHPEHLGQSFRVLLQRR